MRTSIAFSLVPLLIVGRLAANPAPYWDDPIWKAKLVDAIGSSIRWAENDNMFGFPPSVVTVEFDYSDNKLSNATITQSTGSEHLDKEVIAGINDAHPPSVYGQDHPIAHHFQVTLNVEPNELQLRAYVHSQISEKLHLAANDYPESATRVFVTAQYQDGVFTDVKTDGPPGSNQTQNNVVKALQAMPLPSTPPDLAGKKLEFTLNLCVTRVFKDCVQAPGARRFGKLFLIVTPQ